MVRSSVVRWFGVLVGCVFALGTNAAALKHLDQNAIQAVVDATASELKIPGALILLRTPQGEFAIGSGTTQLGTVSVPRSDTHFRIASNTKTMTAAVIMLLIQEGKIAPGDPISRYVSGIPNGNDITIAQLLSMRSGLYNYTAAPELAASLDNDPTKIWTPSELLALAVSHPPPFSPGQRFDYCNTNYLLLGMVIEKIEGNPVAAVFQTRLFGPLGMRKTMLPAASSNVILEPYAHGYMYGGSKHALADDPYPRDMVAKVEKGTLKPNDDTNQNPSYVLAAGGAVSTAGDLADWIKALVAGKVLPAEAQRQWLESLTPQDPGKPDGQKYGYGISEISFGGNSLYFHGGEMPGYNSFMGYDPANDVTLIIWTNLTVSIDGRSPANSLMLKLLDLIYENSPSSAK